jgi:hypothetical protein
LIIEKTNNNKTNFHHLLEGMGGRKEKRCMASLNKWVNKMPMDKLMANLG